MPTSGPLTEQEIANGKEIFEALDQDNDGKISTGDLKLALGNAGFQLTDGEVTNVINLADADGNGTVCWDEFLKVLEKRPIKRRIEVALKRLFDEFDKDKSGFISCDEMKQLIQDAGFGDEVSDADLQELFARVDTSGDGKVSFEEFLAVFIE